MFSLIAFDADDTLWQNEILYRQGHELFERLIAQYPVQGDPFERLTEIEISNIRYFGYGVSDFVFSLIETAIELTGGRFSGKDVKALIDHARYMLDAEVRLFDGVQATLEKLSRRFPLMLITKGDLLHQNSKLKRSGLREYFRYVEVVSEKSAEAYAGILEKYAVSSGQFLMVGNSLRSDILPVVEIGGWAVYIPAALSWEHENGEPPQVTHTYYEIQAMQELPDLIERIDGQNH